MKELEKEFVLRFTLPGESLDSVSGKVTAEICDWWLSKIESREKELMEKMGTLGISLPMNMPVEQIAGYQRAIERVLSLFNNETK